MSKNLKLKKVIKSFVPEPISCISGLPMYISRIHIFVNFVDQLYITNFQFYTTEMEALSQGLKFAIGIYKNITTNTVLDNYQNSDSDFSKSFIQAIILTAISQPNELSLPSPPKRYTLALASLTQNPNIIISPADKSGGVIIMYKQRYIDKINSILEDTNTYQISNLTTINKNITSFNQPFKKLIKNQKTWTSLIEHYPTIPILYGLPKIHKPDTPLWPIISSISITTHKKARAIAKILPLLLGPSHMKTSGDLLNKIKDIKIQNKTMNSLDITSLYTTYPSKCFNPLATHLRKIKFDSTLPINTLINICKHITYKTYFKFNNIFYKQKYGFPMGNSLSGILACLFLEFLPSSPFKYRLPSNTTYLRYIDGIIIFLLQNIKIEEIAEKLNNVEPSINFTDEKGSNNTIPFLDIIIIKSPNSLSFKVYRKPTNKNDYIYFYSHQNNKTKTGLIIGFYLRTLRIWSLQYLNEEFEFMEHSLKSLKYPTHIK